MQVRARQRTDFIQGKINNVGHSRLSSHYRSAFLCYTGTAWRTLSNALASISDDAYSIESADPLRRYRSALRVARRGKWAPLQPHPLTPACDLPGTRRANRPGSHPASLFARACCGAGAWNSPIQAGTPTAAFARPATTCPGASDRDRASSTELRQPVLRLDLHVADRCNRRSCHSEASFSWPRCCSEWPG